MVSCLHGRIPGTGPPAAGSGLRVLELLQSLLQPDELLV